MPITRAQLWHWNPVIVFARASCVGGIRTLCDKLGLPGAAVPWNASNNARAFDTTSADLPRPEDNRSVSSTCFCRAALLHKPSPSSIQSLSLYSHLAGARIDK